MNNKKVSLRRCTGCGNMVNKKDLIRVIKTKENEIFLDLTGKKAGRGAYICKSKTCLKKAIKAKRIQSNLQVEITEELLEALSSQMD